MARSRLTTTARIALAAASAVTLLALPAAAAARGIATGFLDPAALSHPEFDMSANTAMRTTEEAGGTIVRLYLYWNEVAPKQKDAPALWKQAKPSLYTWSAALDDNVQQAKNNGQRVMLTIRSAPNYAQRGKPDSRGTRNPDPAMLKAFTKAATFHFDLVRLWGIWNEPNSPQFLKPQYKKGKLVSPTLYRNLLKAAAPAVYRIPGNKIVAGETSPFGHTGSNPSPLVFLRKLFCMSGRSSPKPTSCNPRLRADVWTMHPYTSGNPWHHAFNADDVSFGDLPQWKKLVSAAIKAGHLRNKVGGKNVDYWIDEFSWDTRAPDPEGVPLSLHARWTSEALYRAWQLRIPVLLWGQLRDYPLDAAPYQSGFYFCDTTHDVGDNCSGGVVDPTTATAKPSLRAFRFPFVAYDKSGHITVWGRTPDSNSHTIRIDKKVSGGWNKVTQVTADGNGVFSKRFASSLTRGTLRAVLLSPGPLDPNSAGFSLTRPKDRFVNPFGCGGGIPC